MSQQENKMGIMPIGKLLITMSVPMMISMLVQALYNIVDSIFVAKLSENALTAVSLAFPIQQLMISVGTGTAIGVNALLSRFLGAKQPDQANMVAKNGLFLSMASFVLFAILAFFCPVFFSFQTTDTEIIALGTSYLFICLIASIGLFGQIITEKLLASTGKTKLSMVTQLFGAVTNIILDPILIFGLLGVPKLGIAGAALATVIGQWFAFFVGIILNIKYNTEISISMKKFVPSFYIIKKIYSIGIPSIIMTSISSFLTFFLNKILIGFTTTATAVFGVYFKLQSFVFMPVFGLNNGMVPIIAYNFGAKRADRIKQTIKYSLIISVSIMLSGFVIVQLFPEAILKLFNASPKMLEIGIPALRTISLCFIFAGVSVILCSVFQALGKGVSSMLVSASRQLVVLLPAAYFLSLTGKLNLVWLSFPIAEIVCIVICLIIMLNIKKKILDRINEVSYV